MPDGPAPIMTASMVGRCEGGMELVIDECCAVLLGTGYSQGAREMRRASYND